MLPSLHKLTENGDEATAISLRSQSRARSQTANCFPLKASSVNSPKRVSGFHANDDVLVHIHDKNLDVSPFRNAADEQR